MNSSKIKIIHSSPVWLPGTQTWMYTQVKYLPPSIENHIVCDRTDNLEQFALPRIHCLRDTSIARIAWDKFMRKFRIRRHLGYLVSVSKQVKAHVLHSHFGTIGWFNLGAAQKAKMKHVVTFYGTDISKMPVIKPVWRQRYKELFAQVDMVLCEGPHMAKGAMSLGCPENKVRVHHLGIELEKIKFIPRQLKHGEPLKVLIAASFREKKGIPYALEALGRVQTKIPLEITIIGDAIPDKQSKAEKNKILATVDKHNMRGKVRFLGFQAHETMSKQAYENHVFLSPSISAEDGDTEGGAPVSIIEMAASGMPVISSLHCDIPEVIEHKTSGLLAKEKDVDELERHLLWLAENPQSWEEMVNNARKHIEDKYDSVKQGLALAEIYEKILV